MIYSQYNSNPRGVHPLYSISILLRLGSNFSDMVELLGRRFESAVHRLHAGNHALERDLAVSILLELSEDGADARLSGLTSVEEAARELSDFLVVERAYRRVLQP